jgi:hypothetical protein
MRLPRALRRLMKCLLTAKQPSGSISEIILTRWLTILRTKRSSLKSVLLNR